MEASHYKFSENHLKLMEAILDIAQPDFHKSRDTILINEEPISRKDWQSVFPRVNL